MATTFFFRAVASDGKVRSGSLSGDNERLIARELRKQGLTPIYVGMAPKSASLEIKLPSFGKAGRKKDVLFFTGEFGHLKWLPVMAAGSILTFFAGYWLFDRLRDSFAEAV